MKTATLSAILFGSASAARIVTNGQYCADPIETEDECKAAAEKEGLVYKVANLPLSDAAKLTSHPAGCISNWGTTVSFNPYLQSAKKPSASWGQVCNGDDTFVLTKYDDGSTSVVTNGQYCADPIETEDECKAAAEKEGLVYKVANLPLSDPAKLTSRPAGCFSYYGQTASFNPYLQSAKKPSAAWGQVCNGDGTSDLTKYDDGSTSVVTNGQYCTDPIVTEEECKAAAKKEGLYFKDYNRPVSDVSRPGGCFSYYGQTAGFNPHLQSAYKTRAAYGQVCNGDGTSDLTKYDDGSAVEIHEGKCENMIVTAADCEAAAKTEGLYYKGVTTPRTDRPAGCFSYYGQTAEFNPNLESQKTLSSAYGAVCAVATKTDAATETDASVGLLDEPCNEYECLEWNCDMWYKCFKEERIVKIFEGANPSDADIKLRDKCANTDDGECREVA